MPRVPFGPFLPDLPPFGNPGLTDACNVIPNTDGSYAPLPAFSVYSDALPGACLGAASALDPNLNATSFAGTANGLLQLQADTTWADVSKSGSYSSTGTWEFVTYDNLLVATNFNDAPQRWSLGAASVFADLGGSPPKGRYIANVGEFLVLANTYDGADGNKPNRVRWSGLAQPESWAQDPTGTQADWQDLPSGQQIMGITGGEYGVIFCRESLYRMAYVGPPIVFQFDEVSRNLGCLASGSIANVEQHNFFLSDSGFMMFDGATVTPIGQNSVDQWFFDTANSASYGKMVSVVDPARKLYIVAFATDATNDPDYLLIYHWAVGRWSYGKVTFTRFARLLTAGTTLEQIDNVSASLDALGTSLDDPIWSGGSLLFGGFNSADRFGTLSGSPLTAVLTTGETQVAGDGRALVTGVRPLADGGTISIALGVRNDQDDTVSWTADTTRTARSGQADFRSEGRYHRARVTISGDGWTEAQGIDYRAVPAGDV